MTINIMSVCVPHLKRGKRLNLKWTMPLKIPLWKKIVKIPVPLSLGKSHWIYHLKLITFNIQGCGICFFAVAKSGTGTWGLGLGDVGLGDVGLGDVGLGDVGLGAVGLGDVGLGDVINKTDFYAEFVRYNFRWSWERCNMLESLLVVADDFQRPWFGRICLLACLTVRTLGTE